MSVDDDLPTRNERKPKKERRRLSGAREVDVSASLEEFIGSACALLDEPAPIAAPAPEPAPEVERAEPDPFAERMAQIEEALVRAAARAAAVADAPPPRARGRLGVSVAAAAIGAFLGVVVLLVGTGHNQGERPVSAATAPPAPAPVAPPTVAPPTIAPPPVAPATSASAAAPPAASAPAARPVRHKTPARRRAAPGSGGIVDPFAN